MSDSFRYSIAIFCSRIVPFSTSSYVMFMGFFLVHKKKLAISKSNFLHFTIFYRIPLFLFFFRSNDRYKSYFNVRCGIAEGVNLAKWRRKHGKCMLPKGLPSQVVKVVVDAQKVSHRLFC